MPEAVSTGFRPTTTTPSVSIFSPEGGAAGNHILFVHLMEIGGLDGDDAQELQGRFPGTGGAGPGGALLGTAGSAWTDGSCSMEKFSVSKNVKAVGYLVIQVSNEPITAKVTTAAKRDTVRTSLRIKSLPPRHVGAVILCEARGRISEARTTTSRKASGGGLWQFPAKKETEAAFCAVPSLFFAVIRK